MINVLLICSQGASTAMMCQKIKQEADKNNVEMTVKAVALAVSNGLYFKSRYCIIRTTNSLYETKSSGKCRKYTGYRY